MDAFIQQHPVLWGCICFFIGSLPQWISGVWSLFKKEPFVP